MFRACSLHGYLCAHDSVPTVECFGTRLTLKFAPLFMSTL